MRVSLWASSPHEYERNYPGTKPDYFPRVVSGLRLLASAKDSCKSTFPRVALHSVVNRHNFRGINSFVDLALETRCNAVSFSPLHTIFGQLAPFGLSPQDENLLRLLLLQAKEKLRSFAVDHNIDETILRYEIGAAVQEKVPCYIGWIQPRVKVDGTVRPCNACRWPVGNFKEQSFREIWNSPAYRSFRRNIISPTAAAHVDERCDCSFCCYLSDNMRVHRFYKWLSPLSHGFGKPGTSQEF
jgi:MoaA/NifB/PqqE/SkfB family radical SAM enzyme